MTKGRKPKPTALKILEGNTGHRPIHPENEPQPTKKTTCPAWLAPEAKTEWKRISKSLDELGILTDFDRAALAGYCQSYARWKQAEEIVSKKGMTITDRYGREVTRPEVVISRQEKMEMLKFAAEFGMTPSTRTKLISHVEDKDQDEMELLLRGGM